MGSMSGENGGGGCWEDTRHVDKDEERQWLVKEQLVQETQQATMDIRSTDDMCT